jgi:hypothetical protein
MPEQPLFKFVGQAVRDHADRRIGRPIEDKCVPIDRVLRLCPYHAILMIGMSKGLFGGEKSGAAMDPLRTQRKRRDEALARGEPAASNHRNRHRSNDLRQQDQR